MIESIGSLEGTISNNETIIGDLNVGVEYIEPKVQEKSVTPTIETQEVVPDEGYTGLSKVTINAIEDENLTEENIKQGVNILGVEGNFVGGKYAPRYTYQPINFQNYTGTELGHETSMLDTSNFTSMASMFRNCSNLTSLDVSGFDTSNVTDMSFMFEGLKKVEKLDVSNFDTSKVINMSYMFRLSPLYKNLDLSNFNTSKVTNMSQLFYTCQGLETIDLSNFDTSNVTNMYQMFYNCMKLKELDLSNFNTSNVTNMGGLFGECRVINKIDIRNFTFDKVTNYNQMFNSIPDNCLIIVKGQTEKDWVLARRSDLTNVKTIAEYETTE